MSITWCRYGFLCMKTCLLTFWDRCLFILVDSWLKNQPWERKLSVSAFAFAFAFALLCSLHLLQTARFLKFTPTFHNTSVWFSYLLFSFSLFTSARFLDISALWVGMLLLKTFKDGRPIEQVRQKVDFNTHEWQLHVGTILAKLHSL